MVKKAIVIGINKYKDFPLKCCVADANEISRLLEYNDDGSKNFSVQTLLNNDATYDKIDYWTKNVFDDNTDIGLFYFSGHGYDDENDGKIVTFDYRTNHFGYRYRDLMEIIAKSKCKNKIVIIDACYSGKAGNYNLMGDQTLLPCGTTILTACNTKEFSLEIGNHGVFTNLLILALRGGAADLFGRVTPGSIYSYIDSSLNDFEQRPLFKSHVSSFITIRNTIPKMRVDEIRSLMSLFKTENDKFKLDPSFEPTNVIGSDEASSKNIKKPYYDVENGKKFWLLQLGMRNALIKPLKEKHLYYAAMNSDKCILTDLGKHYWILNNKKMI